MGIAPRVSVIMPVLNRERFLPAAIESVLSQTMANWEMLISDGGSVDGTRAVLDRYAGADPRVRWLDHVGLNISDARNALLREARGEYVAVLDSDDIALPYRLALQTDVLDRERTLQGIGANLDFIDDAGQPVSTNRYPLRLTDPVELRKRTLEGWGSFAHTSMTMRRAAMNDAGGYRGLFRHAEDDDLFLRLLERGDLANHPEKLVLYRCHEENARRSERPLYRVIALASAHLRLAKLPDAVCERRTPFDSDFLEELLQTLGARSLPVRLFWIGMLQHHRTEDSAALTEAWGKTLELPFDKSMEGEILRHWNTYKNRFPEEYSQTAEDFGRARISGSIFRRLSRFE